MNDAFISVLIILLCFLPIALVLVIVLGAYYSRKAKRNKLFKNIYGDATIKAPVRINSAKYQYRLIKFKGFQASGILYILNGKIIIEGYKNQRLEFDLRTVYLSWEGTDFMKSGLLQWFAIENDANGKYYINIETGILVLELGTKATTQGLYTLLRNEQFNILQTPPPVVR